VKVFTAGEAGTCVAASLMLGLLPLELVIVVAVRKGDEEMMAPGY
jgi:hypothetical protein